MSNYVKHSVLKDLDILAAQFFTFQVTNDKVSHNNTLIKSNSLSNEPWKEQIINGGDNLKQSQFILKYFF